METHIACMGEGGVGAPAGGSEREKGEREREKEREDAHIWICSMGTFTGQKVGWGGSFWIYWKEEAGREVRKRDANCVI